MECELHPNLRYVVYACGGVIKRKDQDNLYLYVYFGDTNMYEVELLFADLNKGVF